MQIATKIITQLRSPRARKSDFIAQAAYNAYTFAYNLIHNNSYNLRCESVSSESNKEIACMSIYNDLIKQLPEFIDIGNQITYSIEDIKKIQFSSYQIVFLMILGDILIVSDDNSGSKVMTYNELQRSIKNFDTDNVSRKVRNEFSRNIDNIKIHKPIDTSTIFVIDQQITKERRTIYYSIIDMIMNDVFGNDIAIMYECLDKQNQEKFVSNIFDRFFEIDVLSVITFKLKENNEI